MKKGVTIAIPCYSRQDSLDATLYGWVKQIRPPDTEILVIAGPDIKIPSYPMVRKIEAKRLCLCTMMNQALAEARFDHFLATQADIKVHDPLQARKMRMMVDSANTMVTERIIKDHKRHTGQVLHCMMAPTDLWRRAGGWHEGYYGLYAWEDNDVIASMFEAGAKLRYHVQPRATGVYHIDHPKPNWMEVRERHQKAKELYHSRHKKLSQEWILESFKKWPETMAEYKVEEK